MHKKNPKSKLYFLLGRRKNKKAPIWVLFLLPKRDTYYFIPILANWHYIKQGFLVEGKRTMEKKEKKSIHEGLKINKEIIAKQQGKDR